MIEETASDQETPAEKRTIPFREYMMLIGLHAVAQHHERQLTDLLKAACFLTGEKPDTSNKTAELIYCSEQSTVDKVLEHLDIAVEPMGEFLQREDFCAGILDRYDQAVKERES